MPLSSDQLQKVQNWIKSKIPNFSCPICANKGFSTGDIIMANTFDNGNIHMGGNGTPMVQIICNNCAGVTLIASVPIGL